MVLEAVAVVVAGGNVCVTDLFILPCAGLSGSGKRIQLQSRTEGPQEVQWARRHAQRRDRQEEEVIWWGGGSSDG